MDSERETIIDGELVDTYGGDFCYRYVSYEVTPNGLEFYEWYLGWRRGVKQDGEVERIDDPDEIEYLTSLVME